MTLAGQGILGRDCAWCGKPATDTVEVESARLRTLKTARDKAEVCAKQAIVVPACDDHRHIAAGGGPAVEQLRRRAATGVDQLDLLGGADR